MSTAKKFPSLRTVAEFLAWEERQEGRYEFLDGVIRMMVGGKGIHNTLCFNLRTALHTRRPAGCRVYSESFKLLVANNAFYPDILLTCDPEAPHNHATSHALVIAEVLSPSTARFDRFRKRTAYLSMPSLRHYLIVSTDVCRVEVFSRQDDGPPTVQFYERQDQTVDLPGLGVTIPMAEVYQDTDLPEETYEDESDA